MPAAAHPQKMLSSQCRGIMANKSKGRLLGRLPRTRISYGTLPLSSSLMSHNDFIQHSQQQYRSFSKNNSSSSDSNPRIGKFYGRHKDLHSPIPPRPPPPVTTMLKGQLIVEPPVRSRPYNRAGGRPTATSAATKKTASNLMKNRTSSNSPTTPKPRILRPRSSSSPRANRRTNKGASNNPTTDDREEFGSAPVQAVHAAQKIDLASVVSKVFAQPGMRKMMERLSVVVQLPSSSSTYYHDYSQHISRPAKFVAVFRFGSVVFFNVPPREAADLLHKIKQHSTEPVVSGFERKENFCVHIQSNYYELLHQQHMMQQHQHQHYYADSSINDAHNYHENNAGSATTSSIPARIVTGEYCVVQELNMKSVDVISNIMAQSVALDAYNDTVDDLLSTFSKINTTVRTKGSLTSLQRDSLFRTVASNNSIFIDMVSKLGIKDRSDTAWNLSQYEDIHEGLKSEFEIQLRFEHIEFKLDLIQQNAKFFLEVLQSQKSNSLEWIIIVLIAFECILMCLDMSGVGSDLFSPLFGGGDDAGNDSAAASAATDSSSSGDGSKFKLP